MPPDGQPRSRPAGHRKYPYLPEVFGRELFGLSSRGLITGRGLPCRPSGDSCQTRTRSGSTRKPLQRSGRGRSVPSGSRSCRSWIRVWRPPWPEMTLLWCDAVAMRRVATGRVCQFYVGFCLADRLHRPGHPYLAVDRAEPVQDGSGPRVGGQLGTLVAGHSVRSLGQAQRRAISPSVPPGCHRGRGRDGHGLGQRLPRTAGELQPGGQLPQRIGVRVGDVHPASIASSRSPAGREETQSRYPAAPALESPGRPSWSSAGSRSSAKSAG